MRYLLAAILGVAVLAPPASAQFRPRLYSRSYSVMPAPYYYGPPVYAYSAYVNPYGYRSYSAYGVAPGLYGPTAFQSAGTSVSPYAAGPYHSVYWDPFSNTYRYTSGYLDTPTYSYYSPYP